MKPWAALCCALLISATALAQQSDDTDWLQQQGMHYLYQQPDSALHFFERALGQSRAQNDRTNEGLALNRIGVVHKNRGSYADALTWFRQALHVRTANRDSAGVASVLNNLGNVHTSQSNYDSALYYALACLDIRTELDNPAKIASSHVNIGNIYGIQNKWDEAENHYRQSLAVAVTLNHPASEALARYSLGNVLVSKTQYTEARSQFEQALELENQTGNIRNIARIQSALGVVFERENQPQKALAAYRQTCAIQQQLDNQPDVVLAYLNMASALQAMAQTDSARQYNAKALALAHQLGETESELIALEALWLLEREAENWPQALAWHEQFAALRDSVFSTTAQRDFAEIQEQYNAVQRQQQLDRKDATLKATTLQRNLILGGAAIAILIGVLVLLSVRSRAKQQRLIAEQNEAMNTARITDLLKEKELESMEALLKGQRTERDRVSRDLHDQLGGLLATVKLHFNGLQTAVERLDDTARTRYTKANEMLDLACTEVRIIAHNMAAGMVVEFGLEGALEELCAALRESSNIKVNLICTGLENRFDSETELTIYRIAQELVTNAARHAKATELTLQLTQSEANLNLLAEDNGRGFDPKALKEGLGLRNIAQRVNHLEGSLSIDSQPGHGTTIIVDLPIHE